MSPYFVLLLFTPSLHGNQSEPVKRQDGWWPLHCSKPNGPNSLRVKTNILTMACKALPHPPISFLTPNTSLTQLPHLLSLIPLQLLASWMIHKPARGAVSFRLLNLLFPLPGPLCPHSSTWLLPSSPSDFHSTITFSRSLLSGP